MSTWAASSSVALSWLLGAHSVFSPILVLQEELPEPFEHLLQRIARRPKPQQFFGLMGKREAGETSKRVLVSGSGHSPRLLAGFWSTHLCFFLFGVEISTVNSGS